MELRQPGQLSPVVEASDGLYLVRSMDRRDAVAAPLEQVRESVRRRLLAGVVVILLFSFLAIGLGVTYLAARTELEAWRSRVIEAQASGLPCLATTHCDRLLLGTK